jgi:hypothetical protein
LSYLLISQLSYVTAETWNVQKTIPRLEEAVIWRKEMGLDDVQAMASELTPLVSSSYSGET